jgi:hypothetical protein
VKLLAQLALDGSIVAAAHIGLPALGQIRQRDDGTFIWVPIRYLAR